MKKAGERMKPRIFIGSSKESVKIAEKVKSLLDGEYVCQLWCDNFLIWGSVLIMNCLRNRLVLIMRFLLAGKDDYVRRESDRTHKYAARDNVLFGVWVICGEFLHMRDAFFLIQEGCSNSIRSAGGQCCHFLTRCRI